MRQKKKYIYIYKLTIDSSRRVSTLFIPGLVPAFLHRNSNSIISAGSKSVSNDNIS